MKPKKHEGSIYLLDLHSTYLQKSWAINPAYDPLTHIHSLLNYLAL
jgi:hypothetical protein